MKEKELRQHATCSICERKIGQSGIPLFWTVAIERYRIERWITGPQQDHRLGAKLARSLVSRLLPEDDSATQLGKTWVLTVCEECAGDPERALPVAVMAGLTTGK